MLGLRRLTAAIVTFLATTAAPLAAQTPTAKPVCTENSRDCLIKTVDMYLGALDSGDFSMVPFGPTAMRWELGFNTGDGEPALRATSLGQRPLVTQSFITDRRYYVDLQSKNVVLFAMLGAGGPSPIHHTERFKVENGLITEIEVILSIDAGNPKATSAQPVNGLSIGSDKFVYGPRTNGPPKPLKTKPLCVDDTPECMIQTARTYLDGTMNYDLSKVPVSTDWVRTENGKVTGTAKGGTVLGDLPKSLNWVGSHEGARYFVDQQSKDVIVYTMYRSSGRVLPKYFTIAGVDERAMPKVGSFGGKPDPVPVSIHMAQRLHIEKGLITEIEEIYSYNENMNATNWPR